MKIQLIATIGLIAALSLAQGGLALADPPTGTAAVLEGENVTAQEGAEPAEATETAEPAEIAEATEPAEAPEAPEASGGKD